MDGARIPDRRLRPSAVRGAGEDGWAPGVPAAVLFDRDGTLIEDVPYNPDPERVRVLPGVSEALRLLRSVSIATGVVSNQSGIGRRLVTERQVRGVNERVEELLGPFDTWLYCPHRPEAGCRCRKPAPGLVLEATRRLGVAARDTVVVGDIAADTDAARAAGARAVLVPNAATRPAEIAAEPCTAPDVLTAVRRLLRGAARPVGSAREALGREWRGG
ncbi:D-glycero-alpha-D-manno-heptose-1,7-bisphosphate 7-phosphatase [Streptomyces sp. TP-A0874]|uniref:D-glycero-alpha-D-manno-heptose-1,7-bisphosphate 7-phosphatase n=1 Tax=Streptomyces sp. TP-A0874 TaxID=549819 RepID=UPI00099FDFBF|nr:HAD-IIIA family hydrolase [Streptomyces sp. TP-A0874]